MLLPDSHSLTVVQSLAN